MPKPIYFYWRLEKSLVQDLNDWRRIWQNLQWIRKFFLYSLRFTWKITPNHLFLQRKLIHRNTLKENYMSSPTKAKHNIALINCVFQTKMCFCVIFISALYFNFLCCFSNVMGWLELMWLIFFSFHCSDSTHTIKNGFSHINYFLKHYVLYLLLNFIILFSCFSVEMNFSILLDWERKSCILWPSELKSWQKL